MVAKAEHDALERRAPDVAEAVVQAEADQRAARMAGRAAGSSRRGSRAAGSGRRRPAAPRGEAVEGGMGRHSGGCGVARAAAGELAHDPVEHRARARHAAVRHEQAGHDVIVEEQARVGPAAARSRAGCRPPRRTSAADRRRCGRPATKAEAMWSAQPATTGVPARSPVAAAASAVTPPIISCEARIGGSTRRLDVAERDQVVGRARRSRDRRSRIPAPSCARAP